MIRKDSRTNPGRAVVPSKDTLPAPSVFKVSANGEYTRAKVGPVKPATVKP
jgi:hypothetical protein